MKLLPLGFALVLAGCASAPPNSPGVLVLPGSGKSFEQFRFDDYECRQFAASGVGGGTPNEASADSGMKSAVVGAAVGTVAGAAMGNAGVGAGIGLATGALAGSSAANASGRALQQRYDFGYQQCMYAKGHKVPMAPEAAARERAPRASPYGSATPPPPPPPNYRVN